MPSHQDNLKTVIDACGKEDPTLTDILLKIVQKFPMNWRQEKLQKEQVLTICIPDNACSWNYSDGRNLSGQEERCVAFIANALK